MRPALLALCAGLVLAACGGSSGANTWHSLRSVRVTVGRPGLPPPYGEPKTRSFTTPAEVARVTAALNAFHIVRRPVTSNQACTGGYQISIAVVPQQGRAASLTEYRCAGQTTGDIGGDVDGFLASVGLLG